MIEVFLYLLAAAVGYVILWAVIRGAVVSALIKHDSLAAAAAERSQTHERLVARAAERAAEAPRAERAPAASTGKLWTGGEDAS